MKNDIQKCTFVSVMMALYVTLSLLLGVPIVNNIRLDMGYVVLGVCAGLCLPWQEMVIAGGGCIIKALLANGQFPLGWLPSNLILAYLLVKIQKIRSLFIRCLVTALAVYLCIGFIKTLIEVFLFKLPFWAKMISNGIAAAVDYLAILIGMLVEPKLNIEKN